MGDFAVRVVHGPDGMPLANGGSGRLFGEAFAVVVAAPEEVICAAER